MRRFLLAAAAIGGMFALTGGAIAAPDWQHDNPARGMREGGSQEHVMPQERVMPQQHVIPGHSRVTPVDYYYHNKHRYHHRKWHHGRWQYWD